MSKIIPNPLSELDLATYKLTLYLVKPELWNNPVGLANDDNLLGSQAILISESGVEASFAIDNVAFRTTMVPSGTGSYATTGIMQFDLHEPLGFSFLDKIQSVAVDYSYKNLYNAKFVLKVEFMGRDPITGEGVIVPNALYLYRLLFKDVVASMNEGGTRYTVTAYNYVKAGVISAQVEQDVSFPKVTTVGDYFNNAVSSLNENEKRIRGESKSDSKIAKKTYGFRFAKVEDNDAKQLAQKLLAMKMGGIGDENTNSWAASAGENDTDRQTNDYVIERNSQIASTLRRDIMANCVEFSTYITDSLENDNRHPVIEINPVIEARKDIDDNTAQPEEKVYFEIGIKWVYSTVVKDAKKHESLTVDVSKQRTFYNTVKDNAIVKKYDYLYTGQNTEVLDFALEYNGLFRVQLDPANGSAYPSTAGVYGSSTAEPATTPSSPKYLSQVQEAHTPFNSPIFEYANVSGDNQRSGEKIKNNKAVRGQEYADFYQRSSDFLVCDMTIKGDPFWLGTPDAVSTGSMPLSSFSGHEIQVAVVVVKPDPSLADYEDRQLGGIEFSSSGVYRVQAVETKFQSGRFTQTLQMYKNTNLNPYHIARYLTEL